MMEKQKLNVAVRRMTFAHVVFWTFYTVLGALVVPRLYQAQGFTDWPVAARLAVALAPVLPVALWVAASARFLARMPDELFVQQTMRATATAGSVTLLALFAQGWVDLVGGAGMWPRFVFRGFDTTPWVYVCLFGFVWTLSVNRQKKSLQR